LKVKHTGSNIILVLLLIWMLVPLVVTIIYSLFKDWTGIVPKNFSLDAYAEIFSDPSFWAALGRTILICIVPIIITILLVLLALFVTSLFFPKLEGLVRIICMIPYTIQGVILSVSILSMYVANKTILGNRLVMLIGAYCIIILPYIYQGIRNGMRTVNMPVLIEAAEMLGASRLYAYFRIIVPNIMTSIVVSSLLAVGIIFGDYVLVRNLDGSAFQNIQIYLYQAMKSDSMKSSAVFVVIMAVTFTIAAIVLYLQNRQKKAEK
jgi:putative spermidine/putrescine transport system permease protein